MTVDVNIKNRKVNKTKLGEEKSCKVKEIESLSRKAHKTQRK